MFKMYIDCDHFYKIADPKIKFKNIEDDALKIGHKKYHK